ncbi:hypothetical protein G6F37_006073 [Rhizopus arrhizus]|nr:hypothetical protein G6F38_006235 [Rhizopus arrhizus]KAG1158126.1 hypothetical protein G6F37_006073 [Rhizopus arrhizus]
MDSEDDTWLPPGRQRPFIRPERQKNEHNSRLYHYHQRTYTPETYGSRPSRLFSDVQLWKIYCILLTCCIPNCCLRFAGIPDGPAQMAWREKIGLVSFILFIMGCVGFLTFGFTQTVCPLAPLSVRGGQVSDSYLIIDGWAYLFTTWDHPVGITDSTVNVLYPPVNAGGMDATFLFQSPKIECASVFQPLQGEQPIYFPCQLFNPNQTEPPSTSEFNNRTSCHLSEAARDMYSYFQSKGVPKENKFDVAARVYYDWKDIHSANSLTVYNGNVLNLKLLESLPADYFKVPEDGLIARMISDPASFSGTDITRTVSTNVNTNSWEKEARCLSAVIKVGFLDTISIGCMASDIVLYVSLAVILGVIIIKFMLAVIFGWFLSWKLGNFKEDGSYSARMKREAEIEHWAESMQASVSAHKSLNYSAKKKKSLFPQTSRFTQPIHGSTRFDGSGSTIWKSPGSTLEGYMARQTDSTSNASLIYRTPSSGATRLQSTEGSSITSSGIDHSLPTCPLPLSPYVLHQPLAEYIPFGYPLAHTICLVTCYSEGEESIRTTLDSIATSDYPNSHRLLLVICDGLITGSGEAKSTPEICVSMMCDLLVPADKVQPYAYVALADGFRQNNMAKVYAGFYKYNDTIVNSEHQQRMPMITIVKCGTSAEHQKPGNRGKRDSQIILMQFMQKVMFDERMTTMEYEFFNSIWRITGIPPDKYEIVLMVDADTKLYPDALSRLISCAVKDPEISGLCGETKIANKTNSWVSMIQVFEYYISHHQSKAFESIFGGVTCLPGCFCMYRIKAPKGPDGYWVPILANPDIVAKYSENVVDTLHKKNLLLLGEDRYLSTLMLRTFPNRKMMFVPQAV